MHALGLVVPWVADAANECLVTHVPEDTQPTKMTQRAKSSPVPAPCAQACPFLLTRLGYISITLA